jgi:FkbM family methyltransferase
MFGPLINRLLRPLGYSVVSTARLSTLQKFDNYKPSENVVAEHLHHLFARHQVDCVFDVGANDGAYAKMLRKEAGYQGWIFSFEPIPKQIATLQELASKDSKWEVCPYALGASAGKQDFNIMTQDVFSSFLPPASGQPEKYLESNRIAETLEVQIRTVGEVWNEVKAQYGLERLYLKMDTQGFDMEVFAGAASVLDFIPALQSELSQRQLYQGAPDLRSALEAFAKAGYEPSMLHPISFEDDLRFIEADGILVRATG